MMQASIKRVQGFPSDPGPSAWNALLPPEKKRPPLNTRCTADWVIVGAGFTGLSAARRLTELNPADTIVVLEAAGVAEGPAGRNSGFMIDLPHVLTSNNYSSDADKDVRDIRLNRAGIVYALNAKQEFGMTDESVSLSGKINGAITEKGQRHNTEYTNYLSRLNETYERLDSKAMREVTGSPAYIDGVFTPGTAMIQPALFIRSLANGIASRGVKIFERTAVTELRRQKGHWLVNTAAGSVSTPNIILAVNGHLQSFGFFTKQLMHIYTYGSMTEVLSEKQVKRLAGSPRWAITPADPLGTTVRRICDTGGHRLIIRNRATFDASLNVDESRLKRIARTHDQSFRDRFPMLPDVRMAYRWGGRLCLSRNDVPVFGELENGLVAACCQNGLGTAKGTIAGKLAAELALGKSSELLRDIQNHAAPTKLPPEPVASIGASMILKFGEWRAGKEL